MVNCWRIGIFLAFIYQLHFSIATRKVNVLFGNNICSRIVSYEEKIVVPFTDTVKEYYTTWCLAIPPRCTTYRLNTVHKNKTITVDKTKTVFDCCKGYEKIIGSCKPICRLGCNHGECIGPDQCLCNEGWRGPYCKTECQPRHFGRGCENYCSCMHGATCDPKNGSCYCREGYIGTQCEFLCPNNTYGLHCINKCKCQNGAMCNVKNGSCECLPGYSGDFCEKPCDAGMHGVNCEKLCICLNETTEFCSHTDGKCICKAGYKGDYCEDECDRFKYGIRCENECSCANSDLCNHVTGECFCKPGWNGKQCSEKCEIGTFGENCKYKCLPCHNGSGLCNHETGNCECPPGTTGNNCELNCPENYWGWNCSERCVCLNDGICHVVTGECLCLPGWFGNDCSQSCELGTYGFNCSMLCTCEATSTCDPENGMCICMEGYTGSNCDQSLNGELTTTSFICIGIGASLAAFIIISAIIMCCFTHSCAYCHTLFSKKLESKEGGRSMDIIVNDSFSNPAYAVPELPEAPANEPETQIYAAFEFGKNETEGLQRLKSFINQLTDERFNSGNTPDAENTCHRGSKRKQSSMIDLSSSSILESRYGTIHRQSTNTNRGSSYVHSNEMNEEYEPEGLCEFYIVDEHIYDNVRYSKDPREEYIAK